MKVKSPYLSFVATMLLAFAAVAQGVGSQTNARNYDPATEATVKGTVEEVKQQAGERGVNGTHLILKTEVGTLDVHVGPSDYIAKHNFAFAKGDELDVTGSRLKTGDIEMLIAREIKKDGRSLTLRNAQGVPLWSRRGRAR